MDEYSSGMDPAVKKYFRKIIKSFGAGLLWMMAVATAGLFFNLAIIENTMQWYNAVFYIVAFVGFVVLLFYFYKLWRRD
ncbi:MAG: hypothetical protein V4676_03650 [Bacteroidota bacterium]